MEFIRASKVIIRVIEAITKGFAYLGAWIIAPLIGAMVWEVFSRYVLAAPTFWAYEVSYMLMGASFMFGIAYCLQMRRHIRVDFVYDQVSLKQQSMIDLFGFIFLLAAPCVLLWLGLWKYLVYAIEHNELSGESAWNPVVWPFRLSFVIGFALLILQTVAEILKCILVLMGHDVPRPKVAE